MNHFDAYARKRIDELAGRVTQAAMDYASSKLVAQILKSKGIECEPALTAGFVEVPLDRISEVCQVLGDPTERMLVYNDGQPSFWSFRFEAIEPVWIMFRLNGERR